MSLKRNRKIASGLAALATAGTLVVGGGIYAAFTDTETTAPQTLGTGTVALSLADSAGATPPVKFTQTIANMAGGDIVYRTLTVKNTGTLDLASFTLSATTTPSNALVTTGVATGLGVSLQSCATPWTLGAPTAAPTCTGGAVTVGPATPQNLAYYATPVAVAGTNLASGASKYLMFKYELSASVPNTLQNLSTDVTYTFTGSQRTGAVTTQ